MESDLTDVNGSVRYRIPILPNLKIIQPGIDLPVFGKKIKRIPDRVIVCLHGIIRL